MVDKIIENWSKAQKSGAWLPCPRCGLLRMEEDLHDNTISRRADIYICGSCGMDEAMEDMRYTGSGEKKPFADWFVSRTVYSQPNLKPLENGSFQVYAEHEILLTVQDIDDIMVCALEGGVNYWCREAEVIEEKRVADWGHEQIARGGVLMLHDAEEDEIYELNLEKFLTGFKLWVAQGMDTYGAVSGRDVDCGMIDAGDADSIIQLALFGEVVYG